MKDYEELWENFKKYLKSEKNFYEKGVMWSLSEAIVGKGVCENLLKKMNEMDETNGNSICK